MSHHVRFSHALRCGLLVVLTATAAQQAARADGAPALLDDFSAVENTSTGAIRIVVDDAPVGGKSKLTHTVSDGILKAEGEIVPARGQPGWAGFALVLAPDGKAVDLSSFEGVRLRVHVKKGMLSVSANSTEVDNFDYHASVVAGARAGFEEVHIPFREMKRTWTEQTPLRRETIASVSLTMFGMQAGAFAFEIDEIGFY